MKRYLALLTITAAALAAQPVHSALSARHTSVSAKECSDCGCKGPGGDGKCPDEKGKTCHCK